MKFILFKMDQDLIQEATSLQVEELRVLESIYEDKLRRCSESSFWVEISNKPDKDVLIEVTFPSLYPLQSPPIYNISAPWMSRKGKAKLLSELERLCCQNLGQSITYLLIQTIQDFLEKYENVKKNKLTAFTSDINDIDDLTVPDIEHGPTIVDRKSVFQAHLARISTEKEIPLVLSKLKENSKISSAKHNTYAYRILSSNGSYNEGCDDDGEKRAGLILLRTLQLSNLSNVLVIVTRWFGGINLGSDRFRHYTNAATNLFCNLRLTENAISSDMEKDNPGPSEIPKIKRK